MDYAIGFVALILSVDCCFYVFHCIVSVRGVMVNVTHGSLSIKLIRNLELISVTKENFN